MELIIATQNLHKFRELRALLKPLPFDLFSLKDFSNYIPPIETGKTFEENAILKATHAARHLRKLCIADDSGLVVPSLNGEPGIHSARYAGEKATDKENRLKLLKQLQGKEETARFAYFECCIAIAEPEGLKKCVRGICEGRILKEERGRYGFGYDPLFIKHDYQQSFGELDEGAKNKVSHRAKAFDKLLIFLEAYSRSDAVSS